MDEIGGGRPFPPEFLARPFRHPIRQRCKAIVLNVNIGRHVQRAADSIVVVETVLYGGALDRSGIIDPVTGSKAFFLIKAICLGKVHPQMPFSHHAGTVSLGLQHAGYRGAPFLQNRSGISPNHLRLENRAPVVPPCEKAVPGRGTYRRSGMGIRKTHSPFTHKIQVRRGKGTFFIKSGDVSVAHIIGQNIDNVRFSVCSIHRPSSCPFPPCKFRLHCQRSPNYGFICSFLQTWLFYISEQGGVFLTRFYLYCLTISLAVKPDCITLAGSIA